MNDRWAVHRYLAGQMDSRLEILTRTPKHILLAGADGDASRRLLAARYPQASFAEYDPRRAFLDEAAEKRGGGWLSRLAGKTVSQHCQKASAPLPEAQADMLWANLSLITEDNPQPVLDSWAQALKADGLLFFSHFGAGSLPEIRALLAERGIACAAQPFADMHDLGDMLFERHFYDPITDTANLVLDYQSTGTFWQDMDTLGLWRALQPENEAAAHAVLDEALAAGALPSVTLEVLFGHAVKKLVLPENENVVRFFPKAQ